MLGRPLVLYDPRPDGLRLQPAAPLGPWAMRPLERILAAQPTGSRVTLDLERAPISEPRHVAGALWLDREAEARALELRFDAHDMVSAELLAFAGVRAAVRMPADTTAPAASSGASPRSAAS